MISPIINEEPAFKIKNGYLSVLQLFICTTDLKKLKAQLQQRLEQTPDFFSNTPIVLELSLIANSPVSFDFSQLISFMRDKGMFPSGIVGGSDEQRADAIRAGLGIFPEAPTRTMPKRERESPQQVTPVKLDEPAQPQQIELALDIPASELVPPPSDVTTTHSEILSLKLRPTMVIDKPVRTGQSIYAEGANLVVLAIVNAGAELIADGDIHVYATMRGRAIAGAHGNESARIFVHGMEAELLSIAGCFKLFEDGVPANLLGKPTHISLEGSRLVMLPLLH